MNSKHHHLQLLKTYFNLLLFRAGKLFLPSRQSYLINAENARSLQTSIDWLVNYIGHPHEQLGRTGDICPFVRTALKRDKMDFLVFPKITTLTQRTLSNILLSEGLKLLKQLNPSDKEMELTTTNILFPNLPKE